MASTETEVKLTNWTGLNTVDDPRRLNDTDLVELVNFNVGSSGELEKRQGVELVSTIDTHRVRILGYFKTQTYSQILVYCNGKLFYSNNGTSWTQIGVGHDWYHGIQYADAFYIVRTTGVLQKWDGITLTDLAGAPVGTHVSVLKDRMFIFSSSYSSVSSRLYYSTAGDPTAWPGSNFIDVSPGDGDVLIASQPFQDHLVLFKLRSTWTLYIEGTPSTWLLRVINRERGCIGKDTIKEIDNSLFILTLEGVYRTDGYNFSEISKPIRDVFSGRQSNIDSATYFIDSAFRWMDHYVLAYGMGTSYEAYYAYNIKTNAWSKWEFANGIRPFSFYESRDSAQFGVLCGDYNLTGKVFRYGSDIFSDVGISYEASFKTKPLDLDQPTKFKRCKWIALEAVGSGDYTLNEIVNGEQIESLAIEATESTDLYHKIRGPGFFRTLQLEFTTTESVSLQVLAFSLYVHLARTVIRTGVA